MGTSEPQPEGTVQGAISTTDVGDQAKADLSQVPAESTTTAPTDFTITPVEATDAPPVFEPNPDPEPEPEPEPQTVDAGTGEPLEGPEPVSLLDQEGSEAIDAPATEATATTQAKSARVLVSPQDPALAAAVGRWLEREAARDSRLSPLVDRLGFLSNVYLAFETDDPIFLAAPPAAQTTEAPLPVSIG